MDIPIFSEVTTFQNAVYVWWMKNVVAKILA